MKYNPENRHRRSIRLQSYDYAQPGAYFVTIVTRNHKASGAGVGAGLRPAPTGPGHTADPPKGTEGR